MKLPIVQVHSLIHDMKVPLAVIELVVHTMLVKQATADRLSTEHLCALKAIRSKTSRTKELTDRLLGPPSSARSAKGPERGKDQRHSTEPSTEILKSKCDLSQYWLSVLKDLNTLLLEIEIRLRSLRGLIALADSPEIDLRRPLDRALRNAKLALKFSDSAAMVLTSGGFELNRQDVALSDIITRSLTEVFDLADEPVSEQLQMAQTLDDVKSICMDNGVFLHIDDGLWRQHCKLDRERTNQVLVNLLLNAFKFRTERIDVRADRRQGRLILTIMDDGKGFPSARTRSPGKGASGQISQRRIPVRSHGVGLQAVEVILETLGGWMTVDSEQGQGARFTVTLP